MTTAPTRWVEVTASDKTLDWFYDLDPFDQLAHREAFCENNFDQWLKYLQYEFEQQ